MTYRIPRFMFLHALADAGATGVTHSAGIDTEEEYLFDYRPSSLFIWTAAAANKWIECDRGAAGLESIDRMIIPAGHNLDAAAFKLQHSTTGAWGGEETDALDTSFSGTGIQDFDTFAGGGSTVRYWRLYITTSGAWEIPQLYLTRTRAATTRGPDPKWTDQPVSVSIVRQLPTRSVSSMLAANRRAYSFESHHLESTDLAVYDELFEAVSDSVSFYFDPPDDGDDPMFVQIVPGSWRREQDYKAPASGGPTYEIRFDMLEQIE